CGTELRTSVGRDGPVSSASVDVAAMLDPRDDHPVVLVVEAVDDPVGAATCRPVAGQLTLERLAHDGGPLHERAEHELDDGSSDAFAQPVERSGRRRSDDELPGRHRVRYLARNASASTTSPA